MTTQTLDRSLLRANLEGASATRDRAGWILTALSVVFLVFDGATKLMAIAPVTEAMAQLGYPAALAPGIGLLLLACVALYLVPRTAVLGVVLLTGYLGGAISAHVRVGNPLFSHTLFPLYVGLMLWGGIYLRDSRVRALIPLRRLA